MDMVSLGAQAIEGASPVGFDAKYEPEYIAILDEIEKLNSITKHSEPSWETITKQGEILLSLKTKDIVVAMYTALALQKTKGTEGLFEGTQLLLSLFSHFWEDAYPPLKKIRRRLNSFEWWHERSLSTLTTDIEKTPSLPASLLEGLVSNLRELDNLVGNLMPDATPLRDLLTTAQRIIPIVEASPEPSPSEPEQAEPTPAEEPAPEPEQIPTPPPAQAEPAPAQSIEQTPPAQTPPAQTPPEPVQAPPAQAIPTPPQAQPVPSTIQPAPVQQAPHPLIQKSTPNFSYPPLSPLSEETQKAQHDFLNTATTYSFLLAKDRPEDPIPWQLSRVVLWGKIEHLPPSEDGQSFIPAPDPIRLASLQQLLRAGKYEQVALAAEDFFFSSIFALDAQYIIDEAFKGLGEKFACAREVFRQEVGRFVHRFPGIEKLKYNDGTPFANETTQAWLQELPSLAGTQIVMTAPSSSSGASKIDELSSQATSLIQQGQIAQALSLFEEAQGTSLAVNLELKAAQLRCVCQLNEKEMARAIARVVLKGMEECKLEEIDQQRAVPILQSIRDAFRLTGDKEEAIAVQIRILTLRPSAGLGWKI